MSLLINVDQQDSHVTIELIGQVDTKSAPELLEKLTEIGLAELSELRIIANELTFLSSAGLRALVFSKQKMPHSSRLILVGGNEAIKATIIQTGLSSAVMFVESIQEIG